jgi:inosose dehydratase
LEFSLEGKTAGYAQMLDEMARSGYLGTDLGDWGFMPTDAAKLRAELAAHQVDLLSAFVPVALSQPARHAAGEALALKVARLLAETAGKQPFIVLADDSGTVEARTKNAGRVRPELGLTEAQWKTFAEAANRIASAVQKETGLRTVFHHHCAGYVETPAEVDTLLKLTDPQILGLCLDTGHYVYGGGDPLMALQKYYDRCWLIHFKDCHAGIADQARREGLDYFQAVRHGVFCELGKGVVNFPAIVAEMNARGYQGWVIVEQDVLPGMGAPFESAQRNRQYLASIGL